MVESSDIHQTFHATIVARRKKSKLMYEWILIGLVFVFTFCAVFASLIGVMIGHNEMIATGLGCAVRASRIIGSRLVKASFRTEAAIDLVGRNVMKQNLL